MRDLGGLTPEQQDEFEQWLVADKRNLGAYARAEGTLIRVERARGGGRNALRIPRPEKVPAWTRRRVVLVGSVAASIAALGITGAGLWDRYREQTFSTGVGQVREVLLTDGSVVTLNTNSQVSVRYTREMRQIHLLKGEALFDVAKNKQRPFLVEASDTLVRAVGTSFTVLLLPKRPIQVLVREGAVDFKRTDASTSAPVRVGANTRALASQGAPIITLRVPREKLDHDLAWKYGRIAFDDQTLQNAVVEYARYSDVRIVVDPAVANETITGSFVSNDPIGFAKTAASVLGLQMEVDGREVRIYGRPSPTR